MSRRILWITLSLICLSGLIGLGLVMVVQAGANQSNSVSNAANDTYTIQLPLVMKDYVTPKIIIWHQWDDSYLPEYQAIVQEFNMAHPDMAIGLVKVDDLWGALSTAIPAGEGPDIVAYANNPIGEWASAGYLAPLDQWVDLSYMNANFEPAAAEGVIWNDQIWGIPEFQEGIALVYNRDLITDTDVPAPSDFTGLLANAADFQFTHPGQYYLCNQGLGGYDAYHAAPIFFGQDVNEYGGYIDEEGTVYMTTTEAISAAQWISDFSVNGPVETDFSICRDMLVNGVAAIWWTGPWAIPDLQNAEVNYGIAPMGRPFVGIRNLMLTTNAVERSNADTAIEIMKYFGSAEIQKRLTLANKTIPANTEALNDPEVQALYEVAQFGAALNLGTPMGNHIYTACQWAPVAAATMAIWNGSQTPEEAMNTAQAAIETCTAANNPSKIIIWHQWNDTYLPEYQNIANEYNAAHPGLTVKLFYISDMSNTLENTIPYGAGPDIVAWSNDQIGVLASVGYLAPLDPWITPTYLIDNFEPAAGKGMIWEDQIWGIPDNQEGIALVYNRDVISDTEIPAPYDWATLSSDAEQFQHDNPGINYLCNQGLGNADAYHEAPIYFGYGLSELGGYVGENGTVNMTTTEAINAAKWISDFSINGPPDTSFDICNDMFVNGQAAIWWTGPWAIADLQSNGVNYGIAPMGSPFVGVKNFMMTTNAVDRGKAEAAIDIMKYFGSFEVQIQLTLANKTIPANTAALIDPDVQAIYEVARFGDSFHRGTPMATTYYAACQWGPVGDATMAIWNGTQTPVDAMNAAQASISNCVANFFP